MTADAFSRILAMVKQAANPIPRALGYGAATIAYAVIFLLAIAHLALIEIRQANMKDFDALIAMLEQEESYLGNARVKGQQQAEGQLQDTLTVLAKNIAQYRNLDVSLDCPQGAGPAAPQNVADGSPAAAVPATSWDNIKTTAEYKSFANRQLCELLSLQAYLVFQKATLPKWYDQYIDGLRGEAPQLIPLLRYVDSPLEIVTFWTRLPLGLLEMLLLVCMGALGGVIAVTRCFVDGTSHPTARDLLFRPAAGAVIALGIYVLFRAVQLFFGAGGGQDNAAAVSTSVYLLAGLGLAAGFAAREAVDAIQVAAKRIVDRVRPEPQPDGNQGKPA